MAETSSGPTEEGRDDDTPMSRTADPPKGSGKTQTARRGRRRFVLLRRIGKTLQVAWSIFGIVLVLLILVNAVFERLQTAKLTDYAQLKPDYFLQAIESSDTGWVEDYIPEMTKTVADPAYNRWYPYAYFRSRPFEGEFINVDSNGIRRTWKPPADGNAPKQKPLKVFLYGGSTMWGYGDRDDYTIASALAKLLYEKGISAEVINQGQLEYVSTQEVIALLTDLQQGVRPDVVVFLDGFNDYLATLFCKRSGLALHEKRRHREYRWTTRSPLEFFRLGLMATALAKTRTELSIDSLDVPVASEQYFFSAYEDKKPEELAVECAEIYAANVRIVEALAQSFDFKALFYFQPALALKGDGYLSERERKVANDSPLEIELARLFRLVYEQYDKVAKENGHVHDLGRTFDTEAWKGRTAFYDTCHLVEDANHAVAQRMLPDILAIAPSGTKPQ